MAAFALSYEGLTRSDIRHIYSYKSPHIYIPAPRHFGRCQDLQQQSLLQRYPPRFYDYYPAFNMGLPRAPAFDTLPTGSIRELVERMRRPIACQRDDAATEESRRGRSRSEGERDSLRKKKKKMKAKTVRFKSPTQDHEASSEQGKDAARQLSPDVDQLQQVVSAEVRPKDRKKEVKGHLASKPKSSDKDKTSAKDSSPSNDKTSDKENLPSKDKPSVKESSPSKDKSSVKESSPPKDKPSVKESSPSKDKPSVKESSPSKDKSSVKESSPSKDKSSVKESSPSKDKSSVKESSPSKDKSPTKESSPAKDKSPVKDNSSHQQKLKLPEVAGKKAGEKPVKPTGRHDRKSGGFKSLSLPPIHH